jgi:hypothetical protein
MATAGQTDGTDTRKIEVRYRTAYWDVRPAGLTLCYKDAAQLARVRARRAYLVLYSM